MPLGILFWVLWVVWLIFGFALRSGFVGAEYGTVGTMLLFAALFGILGWKSFGPVVQ
jgi:hypothetical protein